MKDASARSRPSAVEKVFLSHSWRELAYGRGLDGG